jgi:hypothetical protein
VLKTLVLVLGARVAPYPMLTRTMRQTWAATPVDGIDVLSYHGGDTHEERRGEIALPVADDLDHVGHKTLLAFEHVLARHDFDLLFRTNLSSYVDLPNLRAYVDANARPERYYAGKGGVHDGIPFASGAGYFLSRDLVELVVANGSSWEHEYLDDVALAKLLGGLGVESHRVPRVDLRSVRDVRGADLAMFHFRCKTETRGRRGDVEIIRRLHERFAEARGLRRPRRSWVGRLLARA